MVGSVGIVIRPGLLIAMALGAATIASAQTTLTVSGGNIFKFGEVIPDSTLIKLGDKEVLRLVDQKTNRTLTLTGPYEGPIADYRGTCGSGLGRCIEEMYPDIGGSRRTRD